MNAKLKRAVKLINQCQDYEILSFETIDYYINKKKWAKELKSGKTRPPAMCCEHLSSNIAGCTSEKYEGDSVKNSVNPSE